MKYFIQMLFLVLVLYSNGLNATESQDSKDSYLSKKIVRKSIEETLKVLNEVYVYPNKAKIIQTEISKRMNQGAYDNIKTKQEFVSKITDELIDVSKDGHLGIMIVKDNEIEPTHVLVETKDERKNNYAFQKIEILSGNIGYMKFNKFYQDEKAKTTVDYAFGFLSNTDAMIFDLRDNIGGSPELVRYMLSHFFNKQTLLWRIHDRGNKNIHDHVSIKGVGSIRFKSGYPLYILVGPNTASAAEIFSYTLKHFGMATLIGEKTMGIAHAVNAAKINQYFTGRFSVARPSNPITNTSWEVIGVIPNIKSVPDKSLKVAHTQALDFLRKRNEDL